MNARTLKPGWKMVKFGEVVKNANLVERDPQANGIERVVGLEHIDPENLHIRRWNSVEEGTSFTRKFVPGQTLFGKRRAYQRKVGFAEFEGLCSGDILTFEPKNEKVLLPELLPFICQSDAFFDHALDTSAGSLSPRTSWTALKDFEFPLPPLDEQKRIAEILWAADEAVERFLALENDTEKARRVTLFELIAKGVGEEFRGLTLHSASGSWRTKRVSMAGEVQLGRQRAPRYQSGKWTRPYLRVANVFDGYIDFEDILYMDFDERDFARYALRAGDILLNEGQSRELVGRCAMFEGQVDNCCFQNTLVRFRCNDELVPEFAFSYFQYLFYRQTFSAVARQTTSIAHLGADTFQKLFIPIPPIKEQKRIVDVMGHFKANKRVLASQCNNIERTRQALINDLTGSAHV